MGMGMRTWGHRFVRGVVVVSVWFNFRLVVSYSDILEGPRIVFSLARARAFIGRKMMAARPGLPRGGHGSQFG